MSAADVTTVIAALAAARAMAKAADREVRTPPGVKIIARELLKQTEEAIAAVKRLEARL